MNQESLQRANAFLAAVVERVAVGEVMTDTPAEIGRALGLPDALSTARAVRALMLTTFNRRSSVSLTPKISDPSFDHV